MTYERPYIQDIDTPESFCEAVKTSLQYWLDSHTNAEAWAQNWIVDDDPQYFYKSLSEGPKNERGLIHNQYFSFDVYSACLTIRAEQDTQYYSKCTNCGCINANDWGQCENEPECADADTESVDADVLMQWWRDNGDVESAPVDWVVYKVMEGPAFETYREALEPVTRAIEEEIAEVMQAIENAETNADLLQACMWGTRVYHVNGNIMEDYGDSIGDSYKIILSIRDNGLESVFDTETVKEWLSEAVYA